MTSRAAAVSATEQLEPILTRRVLGQLAEALGRRRLPVGREVPQVAHRLAVPAGERERRQQVGADSAGHGRDRLDVGALGAVAGVDAEGDQRGPGLGAGLERGGDVRPVVAEDVAGVGDVVLPRTAGTGGG